MTPEAFRRYARAAGTSPVQARTALALALSPAASRVLDGVRRPASVLAALHDLALAGRAPELAEAYAVGDLDAAAAAGIDAVLRTPEELAALARRPLRSAEPGRAAVLYPAVAEAARRVGAASIGLVDVGGPAGLNLTVDRVGISYGDGRFLGDPASPVQVAAGVRKSAAPDRAMPPVAARLEVDPDPVDVTDPAEARWLRACVPPDEPERAARLAAELALAAADPPELLRGDPVELLSAALDRVPAGVLPVVTTTWALARLSLADRLRFLQRLDAAATRRAVAWVSVEGVGVAPGIPTFGDRPASGHSIIGVAVFGHGTLNADAVGRCWSRGRLLSWLA